MQRFWQSRVESLENSLASITSVSPPPLWLRISSLFVLVLAVTLFLLSLHSDIYRSGLAKILVPALLLALAAAVLLNIYTLWHARNEQYQTDLAFRDTDCELSSIFQNVLDGILILDNRGHCLDANPAAASILQISRASLIGLNLAHFFPAPQSFVHTWESFLNKRYKRGLVELMAENGTTLFVDFTAAANYLPGRHVFILCDATERRRAEMSLRQSEERFQQMANNIQEIFWMMDADTQEVTYVNHAYITITGHSIESLYENPSSYRELIHPQDRIRVLSKLQEIVNSGSFDEEFRFIRADGFIRWIWAKGFPVPAEGATRWLVGTAQDITSRKCAEMQVSEHLDAAEAARAEAEALRKSTLALSQNLSMDSVLDTLLQCISDLVPFDSATILFAEGGSDLMIARESPRTPTKKVGFTLDASKTSFLQQILFAHKAVLLSDTANEPEWGHIPLLDHSKSWLGIPLVAAGRVLGILSLGTNASRTFTLEHLRLAKSLAIPAAVAIQNARTLERAEIYATELELRLQELREAQKTVTNTERKPLRLREH